jgi:hypothetical protein
MEYGRYPTFLEFWLGEMRLYPALDPGPAEAAVELTPPLVVFVAAQSPVVFAAVIASGAAEAVLAPLESECAHDWLLAELVAQQAWPPRPAI